MVDEQLRRRVDSLRDDFQAETGQPFRHFFCPLLHTDEDVELCKGHVIPDAFKTYGAWVPQRADIDNFYGSATEADFQAVLQDRGKTPFEKWFDPTLRKRHRPHLEFGGRRLEHYFPRDRHHVQGQTRLHIVSSSGEAEGEVVIKAPPEEVKTLHGQELRVVVTRDCRPAVTASLLKAAHLTMFHLLGYSHALSPTGRYLASMLKEIFANHRDTPRSKLREPMADHFRNAACMITPMLIKDTSLMRGTVLDRRLLACVGATEGVFAIGVIVPAGTDTFCVFIPSDHGKTIDTYFGFLAEPPSSIAVKLLQFQAAEAGRPARWTTSRDEPFRMPLVDQLPR
jgi:hypothetical protein